jgi:hypothetical protein
LSTVLGKIFFSIGQGLFRGQDEAEGDFLGQILRKKSRVSHHENHFAR